MPDILVRSNTDILNPELQHGGRRYTPCRSAGLRMSVLDRTRSSGM